MMDNFLHHFAQKMRKDKVNGCKKEKVDTDRSTVFLLPNNVDVVPSLRAEIPVPPAVEPFRAP